MNGAYWGHLASRPNSAADHHSIFELRSDGPAAYLAQRAASKNAWITRTKDRGGKMSEVVTPCIACTDQCGLYIQLIHPPDGIMLAFPDWSRDSHNPKGQALSCRLERRCDPAVCTRSSVIVHDLEALPSSVHSSVWRTQLGRLKKKNPPRVALMLRCKVRH